jgi:hypothetical protein
MASTFITNWLLNTENCIDYWSRTTLPGPPFALTPFPGCSYPNSDVLSHSITIACRTPSSAPISFDYFPEPYYGNPDDHVTKSAIVLSYNPGPMVIGQIQHGDLHNRYLHNFRGNYQSLATAFGFLPVTLAYINSRRNELNAMLPFIHALNKNSPLFMDMVPWHSKKFSGFRNDLISTIVTLKQVWENVFIPAILNAKNSLITHYIGKRKIVFIAVGAKYSVNILPILGFDNITTAHFAFPPDSAFNLQHTAIDTVNGRIKIWRIQNADIETKLSDLKVDNNDSIKEELKNYDEMYCLNMWTLQPNMRLLGGHAATTLNHVLGML